MRTSVRILLLALVVVLAVAAVASAGETIKRVMPENGLTVILRENHSSPVVNMRIYFKAGSIYEGEYLGAGISHYVEHLLSDGTPTRTLEDIEREIEMIGGGSNAYTTKDHTCYFMETSPEHFSRALDILSDWSMNASFPQEAVDAQKGVITREINMGYDEPARRIYALYGETMFERHPYKYPVIGYIENFDRLTRDDVVKYKEKMYLPNNAIFVAVGDFDAEEAYEEIRAAFAEWERKPIDMPTLTQEPPQLGRRERRQQRDLDMAYVMLGFHTVPLQDPDLYPLDVLSHIMSEGESSRLYQRLVNELQLVYGITSWSSTPNYGAGSFVVSMQLDPANVDAAVDAVLEELYAVKDRKVSRDELEKAKQLKAAEFWLGRQDMESIASSLGQSELGTGNPDFDELYVEHIQNVTADEIIEVANRYFYEDNLGIAILEPYAEETAAAATETEDVEVGEVERFVLDNGLTVLVKENHTTPIVSVGSYTVGGARVETIPGLGNFTASMLPRGTKKMSGEKISETFDAMGAVYNCSANHTRIQSSLTLLSQDFEDGFKIFADVLLNPKFDEAEIEKQRELIKAGILARKDDWATEALDRMVAAHFGDHPYGHPPVGTEETVDVITRDDMVAHHAAFMSPDNTVVTIFGDVAADEAVALAEKTFGKWTPANVAVPARVAYDTRQTPEVITSHHTRAQAVIAMGFPGMPYQSEDRYAMDVLDGIISGIYYPGGWLHADLRGKGLVYVVHAYNWTGLDEGYFGIYAATFDEALEEAVEIIDGYIEQIKTEEVTDEELELAKNLCIVMDQTQSQTNAVQANDAAIAELYGLGYDFTDDYAQRIAEVTKEDVLRVARKYLNNPVTILRRPEPTEETTDAG